MRSFKIIFTIISISALISCGQEEKSTMPTQKAIAVTLKKAEKSSSAKTITASGQVQAAQSATLSTRFLGNVETISVHVGDKVQKDQILISLDAASLQAKRSQTNASIIQAEANLKNVQVNFDRYKRLFDQQSISKKELAQSLEFLETHLKENPRDGVKLFGVLTSQVRRLLLVKYFLNERLSETEIFSKLRIHPFLGRQLLQNTKGFTLTELENIQVHLAEIDLSIKFQQQHVRPLFQNLLEKICLGHFQFSPVRA